MAQGKHYDREFRLSAACMVVDQGFSQREVARRPDESHMESIECFKAYSIRRLLRIRRIIANSRTFDSTDG